MDSAAIASLNVWLVEQRDVPAHRAVRRQVWLRTVFLVARRTLPRAEWAAFEARADEVLEMCGPA